MTDYTALSFADVTNGLHDVARDVYTSFGGLDVRQLNWRPDPKRWSVAQCLDHLVAANRLMRRSAEDALRKSSRMGLFPGAVGRAMIRSQAPASTRKYIAPRTARPAASDIGADIIQRFVDQHGELAVWMEAFDEPTAARAIMGSPFLRLVTYSVMDGLRLLVAHDHRHVEQARRVLQSSEFPR